MRNWSFARRIQLLAVAPVALVSVTLALYFTYLRVGDLDELLIDRGNAIARQLAPAAEFGVFSGNRDVLDRLLTAVVSEVDVDGAVVVDAAGEVLAERGILIRPLPELSGHGPIRLAQEGQPAGLVFVAPVVQTLVAVEEVPGEAHSPTLGRVAVLLSRSGVLERRDRLLLHGLVILILGVAATTWLAARLAREVTRPVERLAGVVGGLARGELETRVPTDSGGELSVLEEGVNSMAEALARGREELEARVRDATAELAQKKEEAEQASNAKSRFLAAASHDLRQPLHALGLFVAELNHRADRPELKRLVGQVEASVASMEELLDALLDISRLEAGVVEPRVRAFPLDEVLKRIARDFQAPAAVKGLRLRVRPSGCWVRSDPVMLERILINLVSNALRYTLRGGVVVGCRVRAEVVGIQVWDTGVGIAPDQQRAIFGEFYQVKNDARDREKGLGLGLSIVERLARLLAHPLTLRSRPGRGSSFAITVPLGTPGEAAAPAPEPLRGALAGARVLVVDDDSLVREGTLQLLSTWGCLGRGAGGREEALESAIRDGPPDLVICDYRLSGDLGTQVVRALEGVCDGPLATLLVSGDTAPEVLREARAGGWELMHKPLRPARLRAMLVHLLGKRGA